MQSRTFLIIDLLVKLFRTKTIFCGSVEFLKRLNFSHFTPLLNNWNIFFLNQF
jgi:hypothetical protein